MRYFNYKIKFVIITLGTSGAGLFSLLKNYAKLNFEKVWNKNYVLNLLFQTRIICVFVLLFLVISLFICDFFLHADEAFAVTLFRGFEVKQEALSLTLIWKLFFIYLSVPFILLVHLLNYTLVLLSCISPIVSFVVVILTSYFLAHVLLILYTLLSPPKIMRTGRYSWPSE